MELRLLLTILGLLAMDIYAFQAVRAWVSPYSTGKRRLAYGVYWLATLFVYAGIFLFLSGIAEAWVRTFRASLGTGIFIITISKLPIVLILLIDDLRRLAGLGMNKVSPVTKRDTSRSRFLSKTALILGGIPLTTLTYGIVRNAYRYRRFAHDVLIDDLPAGLEGLKIVQISDMHSGSWTKSEPLKKAVEMINAENADIVCMTGDLVNNSAEEMQPFVPIFREIRAKYGVFSIMGNHDYGTYERSWDEARREENHELFVATHKALGWDLLLDENRKIKINGATLGLLGVENWSALRFGTRGDLARAHAGTEDCDCKILMSHDPTHWDAQVRPDYPDIDLTLSGHTHGFQFGIEIPGFRWSPAQYIYKQWAGLYRQGRQQLYVNRGLGFLGYPGRVGILPEVTVLTLKRKRETRSEI